MDVGRILRLADAIEASETFNQCWWSTCLAGHAAALWPALAARHECHVDFVASILAVSHNAACALTDPEWVDGEPDYSGAWSPRLAPPTATQVADYLRRLADEGGEV